MFEVQLKKLHGWLVSKSRTYARWAGNIQAHLAAVAERREIDQIASSCDELDERPPAQQSIFITDARITDLLNRMSAERSDYLMAAGRDPSSIRITWESESETTY